ncbi:MAG: hypothetical protein Q9220_003438 [cf. Caloplaca sp. 1 TL-2023]
MAFDTAGNLMVVESGAGVTNLALQDDGGTCLTVKSRKSVIKNSGLNHGLALSQDGKTLYASTPEAAYSWSYDSTQSSVGDTNKTLVSKMTNDDHTTRTLLLSQKVDGMLLVSRGSTSNVDAEAEVLSSGHSHIKAFNINNVSDNGYDFNNDGLLLGWGLRNSVGVVEHPDTGGIYSVENSVDELMRLGKDVHQDNPGEEMNFHGYLNGTEYKPQGSNYGYPSCFSAWLPEDLPENSNVKVGTQFAIGNQDSGINDTFCADHTPPRLTFQAHMAPIDIKFNNSATEAWVTFRGSWDRTDPVGYKLSVIPFMNGEPVAAADNKTAATDVLANSDNSRCPEHCFRPAGIAFDQQGRLFMSSDATGEIYVVMRDESSQSTTGPGTSSAPSPTASPTSGMNRNTAYSTCSLVLNLVSFALVQRCTSDAVIPANAGHWRQRFKALYDSPPGKQPAAIKADYQRRKCFLSPLILFKSGNTPLERSCLAVIQQLIIDTQAGFSLNLIQLSRFMERSNILHDAFRWQCPLNECGRLLLIMRALFFPLTLHLSITESLSGAYPFSLRRTAYQIYESNEIAFDYRWVEFVNAGGDINFDLIAYLTNFWKFYMAIDEEGWYCHYFTDLDAHDQPKLWKGKIQEGRANLPHKWKGAIASPDDEPLVKSLELNLVLPSAISWPKLHDDQIRGYSHSLGDLAPQIAHPENPSMVGSLADEESYSTIYRTSQLQSPGVEADNGTRSASLSPGTRQDDIKAKLDRLMYSDLNARVDNTDLEYKVFHGTGDHDAEDYDMDFAGIVHALPSQNGVPGWQRFRMASFETPSTGSASNGYLDADVDDLLENVECTYEGVVMPGATMIIGRYHIAPIKCSGPFIYWNVPDDDDSDGTL